MQIGLMDRYICISQMKELLKCLEIFEKENQETKVDKLINMLKEEKRCFISRSSQEVIGRVGRSGCGKSP